MRLNWSRRSMKQMVGNRSVSVLTVSRVRRSSQRYEED